MRRGEWPLAGFTVSAPAAAGLAIFLLAPIYLLPAFSWPLAMRPARLASCLGVLALLGAAGLLSLLHLRKPLKAPRAVSNAGSSWLSREIVALSLFGVATAALAVLSWREPASPIRATLVILAVAEAGALVYSMARLYTLPAVPDWNTPATAVGFIATSVVLGSMGAALADRTGIAALKGLTETAFGPTMMKIAFAAAGAHFLAAFLYSPRFGRRFRARGPRVYAPDQALVPVFAVRIALLAASFTLWGMATFRPAAPGWLAWAGFAAAILSELIGRLLFYSLPDGL